MNETSVMNGTSMMWETLNRVLFTQETGSLIFTVAVIGVLIQLRTVGNQIRAQALLDFGRQYRELHGSLAKVMRQTSRHAPLESLEEAVRLPLIDECRGLFHIFAQEHHARELGLIHPKTWKIWQNYWIKEFQHRMLRDMWLVLRPEYDAQPSFQHYFDKLVRKVNRAVDREERQVRAAPRAGAEP